VISLNDWEAYLASLNPDAHLLQTAAWGRLKSAFGWHAECVQAGAAGALVLFRRLPFGYTAAYMPRGPVPSSVKAVESLLPELDRLCASKRAAFLKIEPDAATDEWDSAAAGRIGLRASIHAIQPPRTILVDLRAEDEERLARMKPKTRYNIRLAERHGVSVSSSDDVAAFGRMMGITGRRDSFDVHSTDYYRRARLLFEPHKGSELFLAWYRERPIAGLMVFAHGNRAWYLFGASTDEHRDVMAPYLLQWEAMRWARQRGCAQYDLWGIPDRDEATLEAQFTKRQDGLWGVYRFKRGFGGTVWRSTGAWDRVYHPALYAFYRVWTARRAQAAG
jgi:peptidoglycan pentaglycine glycine transferase (the first glycine)